VILLNIAVLFIGKEVGGAKSWFGFGGFGIQPSEFLKLATSMALAKFLGGYGMRFSGWKNITYSIGIFLFPVILILLQNDTGSALVYFSFFLVLYREGMPGYIIILAFWMGLLAILSIVFQGLEISSYYLVGTILGIGSIAVYFARKSRQWVVLISFLAVSSAVFSTLVGIVYDNVFQWYQKDRIEIVLGLKEDKQGMGYNLDQSKVAIGAGRFIGRGFQNGTQTKMGFVPEQHTDFIFCTIGEEWGFVGVIVFFSAFLGLLIRLIQLAERQSDAYGRILGYSVCCILFFHWFVNIGMTIGLIPVIGIPLPFVSAGGSSLWGFTLLLFTFLRYDQVRRN
jgi:rod shape determining protein RodA